MSREGNLAPGDIVLLAIVAAVGGVSALLLIGPDSPTHNATSTSGTLQADLLVWPLLIGLPAAAMIVILGWWYYA